jgi:hypothetical protein
VFVSLDVATCNMDGNFQIWDDLNFLRKVQFIVFFGNPIGHVLDGHVIDKIERKEWLVHTVEDEK